MLTIWVPASKDEAIEVLRRRRDSALWSDGVVGVMAANYDSNGEVGEWDGLELEDLENYELGAAEDGVDLMEEWSPFRLTYDVPEAFAFRLMPGGVW